jgi:hypothetical protein
MCRSARLYSDALKMIEKIGNIMIIIGHLMKHKMKIMKEKDSMSR